MGGRAARVHANRRRRIGAEVVESGEPRNGVFPDSLGTLGKIKGTKDARCPETGELVRWLKVQVGGMRSRRWTKETYLPDVVVKLYDKLNANTADAPDAEDPDAGMRDGVDAADRTCTPAFDEVFGSSTEEGNACGVD